MKLYNLVFRTAVLFLAGMLLFFSHEASAQTATTVEKAAQVGSPSADNIPMVTEASKDY